MNGPFGASGPPPSGPIVSDPERRQRTLTIGLGIVGAFVLLVGVIAFVATRGGDSSPSAESAPAGDTTTTTTTEAVEDGTTTSSSTTTSSTTTGPAIPAVADAGADLDVDVGAEVTLVANGLSAGTPDAAVRWTQTAGPDVTAGSGALSGAAATFLAPAAVTTLMFDLEVAGTDGVATDDLIVRVFEDASAAVFVDGERGDDGGDGSRAAPYRTVRRAVAAAAGRDLYLRSFGVYDETEDVLAVDSATSIYGGFDADWVRDVDDRAVIEVGSIGIQVTGATPGTLSAIEVLGRRSDDGGESRAVDVEGPAAFAIIDCRIVAADAGDASDDEPGAAGPISVGVAVENVGDLAVIGSTVNAGRGGMGTVGGRPVDVEGSPATGSAAVEALGGSGGAGSPRSSTTDGRNGGNGGVAGNGAGGEGGAAGGTSARPTGAAGAGGAGGAGGRGGDGGAPYETGSPLDVAGDPGADGDPGGDGAGGGGGGGGFGSLPAGAGGGGGGGGGGGASGGGAGGLGGGGGGGSIALLVVDVESLRLIESTITAALGGAGARGSAGSRPAAGAGGGAGEPGFCQFLGCDATTSGSGGGGGGGGAGGVGGGGGGGAGGPSIGLHTTRVDVLRIESSNVRAGAGGAGADGGTGGRGGADGAAGNGRTGGTGGSAAGDAAAVDGVGGAGGASVGWFDADEAIQEFDDAVIEAGPAGPGGRGREPGPDGEAVSRGA